MQLRKATFQRLGCSILQRLQKEFPAQDCMNERLLNINYTISFPISKSSKKQNNQFLSSKKAKEKLDLFQIGFEREKTAKILIHSDYSLISTVMGKDKKQQKRQEDQPADPVEESQYSSSEDEDAALLTDKVQQKLLSTFAKIKMKHPSIYKTKQDLYQDKDFQEEEEGNNNKKKHQKAKYTYKDLVKEGEEDEEEEEENLPPVLEEKKAKEKFKNVLNRNIQKIGKDQEELFTVKTKSIINTNKQKKEEAGESQKFQNLTHSFAPQSKKIINKAWNSDILDETDLFLKDYILNKKWLSTKFKQQQNPNQQKMEEQDEERSVEMDQYEATYNFRYQQPGGTEIKQYPRQVQNSLRQKTETRREQRKKKEEKKRKEEQELRNQAELKKNELKQKILEKITPENEEDQHDWFFCDDCCKALAEDEKIWQCTVCEDFMLCDECNELIIHKHPLKKSFVPAGFGAPTQAQDRVKQLQPCIVCRRRITPTQKRYEYTDRNYIVNSLCQLCYDQSNLQMKKKFKQVQAKAVNYEQILEHNPEKIKQLTNQKQIEEMVDEYLKNDFQDVISGGVKTKFKYIQVKPQSYGLSDQQILFGDDKQLNNYISIKKLAPYREGDLKLRNSIFNKKIKTIQKSVRANKNILEKGAAKIAKMRYLAKRRNRVEGVKKRLQKKLKIVNVSSKQAERNYFVSSNRLLSYGIANQQKKE